MAQIIGVVSLGIVLALAALVWNNRGSPTLVGAAVSQRPTIDEVMKAVDGKGLPEQQIEDRALVFSDKHDQ